MVLNSICKVNTCKITQLKSTERNAARSCLTAAIPTPWDLPLTVCGVRAIHASPSSILSKSGKQTSAQDLFKQTPPPPNTAATRMEPRRRDGTSVTEFNPACTGPSTRAPHPRRTCTARRCRSIRDSHVHVLPGPVIAKAESFKAAPDHGHGLAQARALPWRQDRHFRPAPPSCGLISRPSSCLCPVPGRPATARPSTVSTTAARRCHHGQVR